MNDQLDKELSKRIHDVFDAYDEPFSDANWKALLHKRKKIVWVKVLKWTAMAASMAVLMVFGVKLLDTEKPGEAQKPTITNNADKPSGNDMPSDNNTPVNEVPENETVKNKSDNSTSDLSLVSSKGTDGKSTIANNQTSLSGQAERALVKNDDWVVQSSLIKAGADVLPQIIENREIAAGLLYVERPEPSTNFIAEENKAEENGREIVLFADNNAATQKDLADKDNFSFGFVTTSLMNYAEGNTSQNMHLGAGITSAIKLGNGFSLRSGLILAKNSLSLNQSNPVVSRISANNDQSNASLNSPTMGVGGTGEVNTFVRYIPPSNVDVDLLLVDIPINVSYKLNLNKTELIITGGLSSFAYLDQEYSYFNSAYLYSYGKVSGPDPVTKEKKGLSHFDFAKQLNFAVGTSFPLGKKSSIIIEPYIKYPLGELTSENIRYGSMGLSLRFSLGN